MEPQSKRTVDDECGGCFNGYYLQLETKTCQMYGGSCSNGVLADLPDRRQENQCSDCNPGYHLVKNMSCLPWHGGACNGTQYRSTSGQGQNTPTLYIIIGLLASCVFALIIWVRSLKAAAAPSVRADFESNFFNMDATREGSSTPVASDSDQKWSFQGDEEEHSEA